MTITLIDIFLDTIGKIRSLPGQECFHEFTTGLMSLDTALNEMLLSRVNSH